MQTGTAPLPTVSFCETPFAYHRRKTRVVMIGRVAVGGDNPIRLQSMTTTRTTDTESTVNQVTRLVRAGCEIVRLTVPSEIDAQNLRNIRAALDAKNIQVPLVADVHFRPAAALQAAEHVEKVRINPGNYADSKSFKVREYSDTQYRAELSRIAEEFTPLVLKLKQLGRALRIGTNHGSLSDRILNRYGDTPEGMVQSALEFVRICREHAFHDIVLSMKASNPKVMIAAYRLLAAKMKQEDMDYPFHLGITEAGEGEDGRIKSAIGLCSLLEDGIGDTIRVSLTEEPENEIPVARNIACRYDARAKMTGEQIHPVLPTSESYIDSPFAYSRRRTREIPVGPIRLGDKQPVRVSIDASGFDSYAKIGLNSEQDNPSPEILEWSITSAGDTDVFSSFRKTLKAGTKIGLLARVDGPFDLTERVWKDADAICWNSKIDQTTVENFRRLAARAEKDSKTLCLEASSARELLEQIRAVSQTRSNLLLSLSHQDISYLIHEARKATAERTIREGEFPLHLRVPTTKDPAEHQLLASAFLGSLLCDGIGDSIYIGSHLDPRNGTQLAYNILQAAAVRITKTEFVSCPSCGRTLFDLPATVQRIKSRTAHLKNIKIAVMGCIVNGPGEMADADFGYVGGGVDKINLYVGKTCVEKGIPAELADQKLIDLIRQQGKWEDPR